MTAVFRATITCTILMSCCESGLTSTESSDWGNLTVTENLIRREILRLGGDWESGAKPKHVAFSGDKFESSHFEMLTHLPSVEFFAANDCKVDNYAVKCLSSVMSLKRLDFVRCKIDTSCMPLLRSNRELRELSFEELRLSDKTMGDVTRLSQVEKLVIIDADMSEVSDLTIDRIGQMDSLKACVISNCKGMSKERIDRIRSALANKEKLRQSP